MLYAPPRHSSKMSSTDMWHPVKSQKVMSIAHEFERMGIARERAKKKCEEIGIEPT